MSLPLKKRVCCHHCLRPLRTCICHLVKPVSVPIELVILQHPSEVGHPKGTAWLAHQSIRASRLFVGDQVKEVDELQTWLDEGGVYLLYPCGSDEVCQSMTATDLSEERDFRTTKLKVLVLDGTWRKTYRLLQSHPALLRLPRLVLSRDYPSGYRIRKAKRQGCLSTIEAIYGLLSEFDPDGDYHGLIESFEGLVAMQQAFRPAH